METTIQYLQIATDIIIILLFIGLVILVFTLIKTLKYFSVKIEEMSVQVKDIKSTMNPAIDKFQDLTENVNGVFLKVRDNIDVLTTVVEKVRDTTDNIIEFEQNIQSKIEPPVMNTSNTFSAVTVGVKTFFDTYKSRKNEKISDRELKNEIEEIEQSIVDVNEELDKVNVKLNSN
ncbi:MAG: DUF948 domain-containing protein [Ignavibacteria bacterium]|nr:DUF948 domain-containing protein [Ignavibacteria bacterium]